MNIHVSEIDLDIKAKMEKIGTRLGAFCTVKFGAKIYQAGKGSPKQTKDVGKERSFEADKKLGRDYFKLLEGKDVVSYRVNWRGRWVKYGVHLAEPRSIDLFEGSRILVRRIIGERVIAAWTDEKMVSNALLHVVKVDPVSSTLAVLGALQSKAVAFYFRKSSGRQDKAFPEIKVHQLKSLPISIKKHVDELTDAVTRIATVSGEVGALVREFTEYVSKSIGAESPGTLQRWHALDSITFIRELNKVRKSKGTKAISKKEELDWTTLFTGQVRRYLEKTEELAQLESELDNLVYSEFGFNEREIERIESSFAT
ncbi:MAG: TaqI-like C-terminal specificity domain-containing protein [Nannocystaceae bacterium]